MLEEARAWAERRVGSEFGQDQYDALRQLGYAR